MIFFGRRARRAHPAESPGGAQPDRAADLDLLIAHLAAVNQDRDVRVLILESTGEGHVQLRLSSGRDRRGLRSDSSRRRMRWHGAACRPSRRFKATFSGAADLALACDFRIGVPHVEFMVPAAKLQASRIIRARSSGLSIACRRAP